MCVAPDLDLYVIADHSTAEEVARSGPNPKFEELGTITVKLQYAMVKGTTQSPRGHRTNLDQETIHEKDLKGRAISHRVKYYSIHIAADAHRD